MSGDKDSFSSTIHPISLIIRSSVTIHTYYKADGDGDGNDDGE